jgi:hypothetical protein
MRIASITTLAVLALLAGSAQAQVYCWTTKEGKRECGDTPPPGSRPATISTPSAPSSPSNSGAKAGSKPPADPEKEFQKRQAESAKAREKEQQTQEQAEAKQENCNRAKDALRILESGQRISRVDKDGERYFLDEQQIGAEQERARDAVRRNCS